MFHANRCHQIREVATLAEVARLITSPEHSLSLCQGFRCGPLVVLNDSLTSDPGRYHEWGVLRAGRQVESITTNVHDDADENAAEVERSLSDLASGADPGVDLGAVEPIPHPSGACSLCA